MAEVMRYTLALPHDEVVRYYICLIQALGRSGRTRI
jgi:hypothetical protein